LRACDELGMLVMDETRSFGTSPEAMKQLKSLIERDRNHPSVFIWCVGNEEVSIQAEDRCAEMTKKITRFIKSLDNTRAITYGANNGENFSGINTEIEIRGINYIHIGTDGFWVDKYHKEHPDSPIIATEESSYVLSRGASKNDLGSGLLDTTGNTVMSWGSTPIGWMKFYEERPYLIGGFMWTGFDYRGEANPFALTNVSSSFGAIDLCGIPKPIFYYYQSQWTDKPVLKLAPHWNYEVSEEVTVQIYTNLEKVTVYINDKEIGTYSPEKYGIISVSTIFEPGTIRTEGLGAVSA
jgi:beta-galactosidase